MKKAIVAVVTIALLVCCFCIPVTAAESNAGVCTLINMDLAKSNPRLESVFYSSTWGFSQTYAPYGLNGNLGDPYQNWYANYRFDFGGKNPGQTSVSMTFPIDGIKLRDGDTITLSVACTFQAGTKAFSEYGIRLYGEENDAPVIFEIGNDIRTDYSKGTLTDIYKITDVFTIEALVDVNCTVSYLELYGKRTSDNWGVITWGFGMSHNFNIVYGDAGDIAIQNEIENLKAEQQKTNEYIQDLTAEQEKTNEMLGEITADKYTPPEGQDQMDELGKQEEIVNQSAQEGLDEVGGMFKAFSLDFFTDGLGAVVQIYNRIIPKVPWLNEIIMISLSLGIFAFLLGTTHSVRSSREYGSRPDITLYHDPNLLLPEHKQR